MAENDTAIGAILEIPQGALRNIEKAEKAIWALHDASKKTADQVYGDFSKRMPMGVDAFIKKLAEAKAAMNGLGTVNVNLNVKGATAEMDSFAGKMQKDTSDISRTIQDLALAKVDFSNVRAEAEHTGMDFERLEKRIENLKNGLKVQKVGSVEGQATINEIRAWEELLRVMKLANEEKNKALNKIAKGQQDKTDKAYLDEQKRLLDRILQLRKDIADVNISVQRGQITGKDVTNEVAQLEKLRQQLVNTGAEYKKLREGKGDLSSDAQTKAEAASQKFYTESIKETLRERTKLNEAITRGNEWTALAQQGKTRLGSGEEAAVQRQLNSDYKQMLKIIKEQGELKAKVASEGRRMTQDEINLVAALAQRYKVYYDDINRIAGAYKNMSASAEKNFQSDKSEQLARNAIMLADAQNKAAIATEKNNKALHDISPVMQAYNSINAQIERENKILQQTKEKADQATQALQNWKNVNPTFNYHDAVKKLDELRAKIDEVKTKAASQGPTKASITLAGLKPLQAEYDAINAKVQAFDRLMNQETLAIGNANDAVSKYTPRLAAMRDESDRLSQKIERLVSANEKYNSELSKGNNVKSLTTEYKSLITTIQRLGEQMAAFRQAGGNVNSASYQAMSAQLQAAVAREKEIRMMSINEVEQFRQQRAQAAYQADISAFIQAEAQKKAEAQKFLDEQVAKAKLAGQQYAQSYSGAMAQFNNMMTGNAKGGLALNLENIQKVLNNLQTAAGKLNLLDPTDVIKAEKLKTAIQELNRIIKTYKDVTNATPDKPVISPQDAINAAKNATTLKQLQSAYTQLKTVMDATDPGLDDWKQMNIVYGETKKRIDAIRTSMGELHNQTQRTGNMMGQLRNQIAAAFSVQAITGFIKKIIDTRAEFELQNVALRAILQNKDEADKIFAQVQQMALQSPFSIMQLNTYTKQLAAYRIESDKLLDTTKMLADVSAGLGVDMQRLILAYGQVKSANYLRATEVRQFTEAGLNITGELATYFSELKGEMITVGDVMEMITKRMVRFEDVEEVFKRVTGESGLFYDMQKKQSETLRGQIQRIADSLSIMMNEIGQSNQSGISMILTLIRTLINNWKVFVNLLYGAGAAMAAYAVKTTAAAIAQGNFNASSKGLVGVLAKVKDAVKSLLDTLGANPYMVLIGAAVAAGAALYDLVKKTNEVKASYDNIIIGLVESSKKLDDISDRIETAQERIEATENEMSRLEKGTDEYTAAAEANKEAVTEQYRALQELRNKFPEVYAEITETADKTGDLTAAIKDFNEVARRATIISTLSREDITLFNPDDIKEDFKEVSDAQNKYNAQLAKSEALLNAYFAKAQALYDTRRAEGTLTKEEEEKFKRILDLKESELPIEEKINKVLYDRGKNIISGLLSDRKALQSKFMLIDPNMPLGNNLLRNLQEKMGEAEKEADALMQRILTAGGVTSAEMFKDLPLEAQKVAKKAGENFIKEEGLALDEVQRDILRRKIEIPLGIRFDFGGGGKEELSNIQKAVNRYIDEHPEVNMAKIENSSTELDDYFKGVANGEKQNFENAKKYNAAKVRWSKNLTNEELANQELVEAEARKKMSEYFGYFNKEKQNSGRGKDGVLENLKNRLKAVQDFYKRYEELQKNFSDTESLKIVQDAFAKLFNTLKIDMDEVVGRGMGKQGLANNINAMLEQVRKARPQLADEFEKAFADVKVQIDVEIQKEALDKIKNDMQNVADNYELSETFRKLGVTTDLVFMLGGKPTTLAEYRKTLEDTYKQTYLVEEKYGKEGVKAYEEQLKKIEQLEQKNAVERAKNYVKYLTESLGERAQIEIKAMREIEAIRSDDTLDDFSKQQAAMQRRNKMLEDLAKVDMENLKSSDVYVSVFKDLENASKEQLQFVINKLRELQSTFKDLSPAQVKSLANDMKKLENALADKDSFKNLGATLKEVVNYQRNRNDLLRQQAELQGQLFNAQQREHEISVQLTNEQIKLSAIQDKTSDAYKEQEDVVRRLQIQFSLIQSIAEKTEGDLNKTTGDINKGEEATGRFKKTWEAIVKILNGVSSAIGDISGGLANMGLMTEALSDAFESAQSIISNVIQTGTGAFQAFTDPNPINKATGAMQALGGAVKLVGSLFNIGDKKKERQIRRLQENVERLERTFKVLEQSIDSAFKALELKSDSKKAIQNLQKQKSAYQEMIRLEQSKKDTDNDKIKEWRNNIQDINDQIKELKETITEKWGGFGSQSNMESASDNFAEVWFEAYKETGDGLDALEDKWDEYINNLIQKQLALRYVGPRMERFFKAVDQYVSENSERDEELTKQELEKLKALKDSLLGNLNTELKDVMDALGYGTGSGELVLSDLQKGIQNITEPQAAAIEAYLNSMRFAVFEQNTKLDSLIAAIQLQYGSGAENPVVSELKGIRGVLDNIYTSLRSVIKTATTRTYIQVG